MGWYERAKKKAKKAKQKVKQKVKGAYESVADKVGGKTIGAVLGGALFGVAGAYIGSVLGGKRDEEKAAEEERQKLESARVQSVLSQIGITKQKQSLIGGRGNKGRGSGNPGFMGEQLATAGNQGETDSAGTF